MSWSSTSVFGTAIAASGPDIDTELAEIAGIMNAQHGRLVTIVEQALTTGEWQQSCIHSPTQWLAWKTGLSPHRATEIVTCAERSRELPNIHAALTRGELAIDQAIAANRAPAWADARIAEFATVQTVAQLRRTITKQFFDEGTPKPEPAEPDVEPDRLSTRIDSDGSWRISGVGDIARGSIIDQALAEAKDALYARGDTDATWFDALVEISQRSLDSIESPSRRDRYRTWIHLDADTGSTTTADGWRIPQPIRDQILCDGVVQPVWERNGVPFNVGRTQRIVPGRTRRIIERRDGRCCRVPGCTNSRYVEIHHITHWINGGTTDTWNLLSLCGKHHRLHHQTKLGITGNADQPDGITYTDNRGRPLDGCGTPTIPDKPPPKPDSEYEHPIGGRMNYGYFTGWVHPDILKARRNRHR